MGLIGVLIGIADIVIGIVVLVKYYADMALLATGISCIISGLLFIWLCIGAITAFSNANEIEVLKKENERRKKDNDLLKKLLLSKGVVSNEDVDTAINSCTPLEELEEGTPLITLVEKHFKKEDITIPAKTKVTLNLYDNFSYTKPVVYVNFTVNGENKQFWYKPNEVMNIWEYELSQKEKN